MAATEKFLNEAGAQIIAGKVKEAQAAAETAQQIAGAKYSKPEGGIPANDLSADVKDSLSKANGAQGLVTTEKERAEGVENGLNTRLTAVESKNSSQDTAISSAQKTANEAKSIAEGASKAKVFDTKSAMETWIASSENKATLKIGDHLLIKDKNVPDYWWDGEGVQELETAKVDLTDYPTYNELPKAMTEEEVRALFK